MPTRPYRLIHGLAYPHLIQGDNPTSVVQANLNNREETYYDEAIRLSEGDISRFKSIVGKPIRLEHESDQDVGEITRAWVDRDGKLRITARIWTDTKDGIAIDEQLQNGSLRGLSVGYDSHVDTSRGQTEIVGKTFNEISICKQGFFPGAQISVVASKSETNRKKYKSLNNNHGLIRFDIMASNQNPTENQTQQTEQTEQTQQTEQVQQVQQTLSTPDEETVKSSQELLKQVDQQQNETSELSQKLEQIMRENKEMAARLAKVDEANRLKEEARIAEAQKQAVTTAASLKQALGADIPEQVETGMKVMWSDPRMEASKQFFEVMASQLKKQQEQLSMMGELKATVAELKKSQQEASNKVTKTHQSIMGINAALSAEERDQQKARDDGKQERIGVEASFPGTRGLTEIGMASVFVSPKPSADEITLAGQSVGGLNVNVSASSVANRISSAPAVPAKPKHGFEHYVQGSLANFKESAAMWHRAMTMDTSQLKNNARFVDHPDDVKVYNDATPKSQVNLASQKWYN